MVDLFNPNGLAISMIQPEPLPGSYRHTDKKNKRHHRPCPERNRDGRGKWF